jgi:hypothetical protein
VDRREPLDDEGRIEVGHVEQHARVAGDRAHCPPPASPLEASLKYFTLCCTRRGTAVDTRPGHRVAHSDASLARFKNRTAMTDVGGLTIRF